MVEGLSKRIAGDWVDLGQAGLSLTALAEYFAFEPPVVAAISQKLSSSVLQGVVEYKQGVLQPLFQVLEDMKYKSIAFDALARQNGEIGRLVFVTLIQRLFASGGLKPEGGEESSPAASEKPETDLKAILADVMTRVREEPALKNNTAVKLILTQLAIYQREREVMEKLKPNIKDREKAVSFRKNFTATFKKISQNIRKYYGEFMESQRAGADRDRRPSLGRYRLRELTGLFTRQAREFARIRSTLGFALDQKYKVREICVHLFNEKKEFITLLDQETTACRALIDDGPGGGKRNDGHEVSVAFASEIAALVGKLAAREVKSDRESD
ncbi:MAG: hypothetical protein JXD23_14845 [Spirochaetales bacterium]|nr:hypothetical protein [Spirochaetales bacterium]